jgi:hypothetical protein
MENVKKLLDEVKEKAGITSDYALAKTLELPSPRICDYYKGNRAPDEFACLKISEYLGKPLAEVIATVKADTEKNEKRRNEWVKMLKRLGGVAASFMMIAFSFVTFIVTYPAESLAGQGANFTKCSQYKLCELASRIIALVRDTLKNAFPRVYCEC